MLDIGLLLFRAAGFLLAFTFGVQKIGWYVTAFHAGKPLLSSIGLTPLIAHMGLPLPVILALDHTERIDRSFLRWHRFAYSVCSGESRLGMIGALYTSVRLEEDWLRAALYFVIFLGLIFTGAGKFSIDRLLQTRKTKQHRASVF